MANSEVNGSQNYYWSVETPAASTMGYYSVLTPTFPPPDLSQPPPTFPLPPPSVPENNVMNSYAQFPSGVPNPILTFPNGTTSSFQCPYQTQMDIQCNQNYTVPPCPPPIQKNRTYEYWNRESTDCNNVNRMETEWSDNANHSTWDAFLKSNRLYPESDSTNIEKRSSQRNRHEPSNNRSSDWRREGRSPCRENGKRRSISPESRSRCSKLSRSRYSDRKEDRREDCREDRRGDRREDRRENRRDRYDKYERMRRPSRERSYERKSERRSERKSDKFYRSNGSYSSRSSVTNLEKCSRRRKRSRSLDSHSSMHSSPGKTPAKQKCLSERELLLEKYR